MVGYPKMMLWSRCVAVLQVMLMTALKMKVDDPDLIRML
jgi:hypothetical protein